MLVVANFANTKMTETLAHGYLTHLRVLNEYQQDVV